MVFITLVTKSFLIVVTKSHQLESVRVSNVTINFRNSTVIKLTFIMVLNDFNTGLWVLNEVSLNFVEFGT